MTIVHRCILLFALLLTLVGCKKDEAATAASQFNDKLTLGTGMQGFVIIDVEWSPRSPAKTVY